MLDHVVVLFNRKLIVRVLGEVPSSLLELFFPTWLCLLTLISDSVHAHVPGRAPPGLSQIRTHSIDLVTLARVWRRAWCRPLALLVFSLDGQKEAGVKGVMSNDPLVKEGQAVFFRIMASGVGTPAGPLAGGREMRLSLTDRVGERGFIAQEQGGARG